ncbi:PAS domain S-box protein [Halovenus sp. WSH3]|uniref:PAS domain S-box protein n=1 Tax=Halovenus carboxidivorans TaxID=2692199 RepID=A0A6B0T0P4_9EURY|nr:PAS domain S-box protein [Halovenus carboxidivorans]MXR51435.1 PAS domain S-box protein [Halovenus carboxidivorans]
MTETEPTAARGSSVPEPVLRAGLQGRTDEAVIGLTADGTVSSWSAGARALTGSRVADAEGTPVSSVLPGLFPDRSSLDTALETAGADGRAVVEGWCRRDSGENFWASGVMTAVEDGEGFALLLRDCTEQRQTAGERKLLADVTRRIAQADSYIEGIRTAIVEVCDHTEWAYGEAWAPAEGDDRLEYVTGHAADRTLEPFLDESEAVTFGYGEGLPGRVYASGESEWIPDTSDQPRDVFRRTALAEEVGLRAALGVPITTEDGVVAVLTFFLRDHRDPDDSLASVVSAVAADLGGLVARMQTEEELDRERALLGRVFTTSPVGLIVTDTDGEIVRSNLQASEILCGGESSLVGRTFDGLDGEFLHPDGSAVDPEEFPVARALDTGATVGDMEVELRDEDGESRWVLLSATPIHGDGGDVERVTVVVEDITTRREREQSLRAFREAIEQAGHSIYFTDSDGTIEYVNPTFEEVTGYSAEEAVGRTPHILNSGEHDEQFFAELWETIQAGEVWTGEVTNEHKSGDRYVVNQTIAPITDETGGIERFVAINDDITEQKRREQTVRRQRNSLQRIRQIIESLRPINRELTRAGTRQEIDQVICEQLAASDAYLFAWIGDHNQATEEITPREWAGVESEFVQDLDLTLDDAELGTNPFQQAVTSSEIQAIQEVPTDPAGQDRRDRAIEYGFQSVAAIPITYGETVLGIIGVYSARPDAFDRYEQGLLRELGERIGHAINAAENKQLLHTDTVVELEFEIGVADSPLVSVTEQLDCRLSLNNLTPTTEAGYLCYVDVDGVAPEELLDIVGSAPSVESTRVVRARGQTGIVELRVKTGPLTALFEHGATISSFEAADGSGRLVGETTPQSDAQSMIETLQGTYRETTFVAKRTRTQESTTLTMTKNAVEAELTDRQREVLGLAYHGGYFESPRDSTGDELADALGISSPTFYQHVRKAIRKILALLIENEQLEPTQSPVSP